MKHKTALVSLVFMGVVFLFSGNAWAGGGHRHGHHFKERPHYGYYAPKHHGWHQDRGQYDKRFHHGPRYRGWHRRPVHRSVEKHVYHYYRNDNRYYCDAPYYAAGCLSNPGFSFSFGISGTR